MARSDGDERHIWVGTSWKMNKLRADAREYCSRLAERPIPSTLTAFVIPPFTSIDIAVDLLGDSPVLVGAQNGHWEPAGAWTGEISMPMVRDSGAALVEIGHSERREYFGDTDERVGWKVRAALSSGLTPLLCVGEPDEEQRAGRSAAWVRRQLDAALGGLDRSQLESVVLAYEPIWAIGENGREPQVAELEEVFHIIDSWQKDAGAQLRAVLYGGSVNQTNAPGLLQLDGVDGLFVGRSAWTYDGFSALIDIAATAAL